MKENIKLSDHPKTILGCSTKTEIVPVRQKLELYSQANKAELSQFGKRAIEQY